MTTSDAYKALVDELRDGMNAGDDLARRCIGAMALLLSGWRYGDPDPVEPGPDDGGGEPIDLSAWKRAA